jgi:hypothetical protein
MNVDPIAQGDTPERGLRMMFRPSVTETVAATTLIVASENALTWGAWSLNTTSWELSKSGAVSQLREVVYVLARDNASVEFVVLVFDGALAVRVAPSTFSARMKGAVGLARVVATVPSWNEAVQGKPTASADFPSLTLEVQRAVRGARASTALSAKKKHAAATAGGQTLYVPLVSAVDEYLGTRIDMKSAKRSLVLGPTRDSDGLKRHTTIGGEVELVEAGACFEGGDIKFCPATGKLTRAGVEHELAEVLYVGDDEEVDEWACVLDFRAGAAASSASLAVRLAPESAKMLMLALAGGTKMPGVLTSTAIRGAPLSTLSMWPNAHGQGTTNAEVTRTIPAAHAGLMLDTRARMVSVPSVGFLRFEPLPSCADYADANKRWSAWDLCAADAAARAESDACVAFKPCAKGAAVSRLLGAESDAVVLYAAPEVGVLHGSTALAAYVVKPKASEAAVVIATKGKSEVRKATKDGDAWKLLAREPLCKGLVECLKGEDLTYCAVEATTCAWTEDRSAHVAQLEYEGTLVDMRALDESAMYGVDSRGAFAMRSATGDVLFVPGAKRPTWPPTVTSGQPSGEKVLKAGYDEGTRTWRVGHVGSGGAKGDELTWLWILLGVLGALLLIGVPTIAALRSAASKGGARR